MVESFRADYPGGWAVVDTVIGWQARWVLGTAPAAEAQPGVWRAWLGIRDDSTAGAARPARRALTGFAGFRRRDLAS
jgi:hypothetical protein